jgi:HAD superfamily hydrolase (TIGR01509 family)
VTRPHYKGVLLDIDGTLVNSNDAHAYAWTDALGAHGFAVAFDEVRRRIGKGGDKLLPEVAGVAEESEMGKAIADAKKKAFARMLPALLPTRGARALVARLRLNGLRLVVATSAGKDESDALLSVAGVEDLIPAVGSSDDVDESKPDPDVVHAALGRGGLKPEETLLIGDTPYDIEAARRAGVGTIALRCGGFWPDDAFSGAVAIYDDPQHLLECLDASPLARVRSADQFGT